MFSGICLQFRLQVSIVWLYLYLIYTFKNSITMELLESHLKFDNGILISVAVVWEQFGEVRASYSDLKRKSGFHHLKEYDVFPTLKLLGEVASGGRKLTDKEKKQYFPTHKIQGNE